jgi:hypothetical protein
MARRFGTTVEPVAASMVLSVVLSAFSVPVVLALIT